MLVAKVVNRIEAHGFKLAVVVLPRCVYAACASADVRVRAE